MTVKVKVNLPIKNQLQDARTLASRQIKKDIVKEIIRDYDRGISPVKGFNRFARYERSTAKKKGRRTPVTIEQTGQIKKSLKAVQKGRSRIQIFFQGARNDKISTFLNFGTPKMNARPLLPAANGQTFKKRLTDKFNKIVTQSIARFVK